MIARVWRGWTKPQNADAYETLLQKEIFPGIRERHIAGLLGTELLRRNLHGKVEFMTTMTLRSMEHVRSFTGIDYDKAVVPPKARALLERLMNGRNITKSQHE